MRHVEDAKYANIVQFSFTKLELFIENRIQHVSTNTTYKLSNTVVEGWACFAVTELRPLAVTKTTTKSSVY